MKQVTTILCVLAFAIAGVSLAVQEGEHAAVLKHQMLSAATLNDNPSFNVTSPLNTQLKLNERQIEKDTVFCGQEIIVIKDTSKVTNPMPKKARTLSRATAKRQGYSTPAVPPDSTVKNKVCGVREEYTPDSIGPPIKSVILIVDGKEVYKR